MGKTERYFLYMNISHVVYKACDLHGGIFNIRDQVPNFNDGLIPLLFFTIQILIQIPNQDQKAHVALNFITFYYAVGPQNFCTFCLSATELSQFYAHLLYCCILCDLFISRLNRFL